jgi:pimeloyl-ACP methyl ester carboxylesterase
MALYRSEAGKQKVLSYYERQLQGWGVPTQTQMVATRYGATHVIAFGNPAAPPLILLHGHSTNASMWKPYAPQLAQKHRIYALDIIGQPGKSAEYIPKTDSREYLDWLCDVLAALGIQQTAFMGISFGGFLSLKFASHHPEYVSHIVALAPAGITHVKYHEVVWNVLPAMLGEKGALIASRNLGKGAIDPELEGAFALKLAYYSALPVIKPLLLSDEELRRITIPMLYVIGDQDAFFSAKGGVARIQHMIPHAQTELLHGETHLFNKRFPQVSARILKFLYEGL